MQGEREWRCPKCRTLLGVERGDRLYLRLRKFQFVVIGSRDAVLATCGVCGQTNEVSRPTNAAAAPGAPA